MSAEKKHTLVEHWNDVSQWWHDVQDRAGKFRHANEQQSQVIFFTAYERWLNDRELLTVEDGYEWFTAREDWMPYPPGAIG